MELSGFIVGPERSGTTLTSAYLSNHPEVYVINDPLPKLFCRITVRDMPERRKCQFNQTIK